MPPARISLTLSHHFSLSFIVSGRSSGLHPISSHSCCMYVLAGRPALARPYVGVHRSTSFMSSSLLLQQFPACLDLTDKMKRNFFQAAVVLILLYGCTTWTLTKWLEKLFITFWVKRFFDIRKREAQSFYDDFSICPKPCATPAARPRWAPKVNRLPQTLKLNSLTVFQIPKCFRCMMSFTSRGHIFYLGFLLWHLWMTHPLRTHVNTCAHVCT